MNGLSGNEFNLVNLSDPSGERVTVQSTSPYIGPIDPDHSTPATTAKIFGGTDTPTMDGFIQFCLGRGKTLVECATLMNSFTPDRLPVSAALAREFAVFDRFFCSHPGPTFPNRLFQVKHAPCRRHSTPMPMALHTSREGSHDFMQETRVIMLTSAMTSR